MEIDNSTTKRTRTDEEESPGNKMKSSREKVVAKGKEEKGVTIKPLKEAWPTTAAAAAEKEKEEKEKKRKEEEDEKKKREEAQKVQEEGEKEAQGQKLQEVKTLVELVLDEAARDNTAEKWKSSFVKSVICDAKTFAEVREEYEDSDEGRLLKALEKEPEILFYVINAYIYKWSKKVYAGISASIVEIYEELEEHAEEVHAFVRIRGTAYKILKYIEDVLMGRESKWNMQAVNNAKSIIGLKDKEGNTKGATITVLNTGGGYGYLEFLCDVTWVTNRLHQICMGKTKCHPKTCPQEGKGKEKSVEKAKEITMGRLLIKTETSLAHERSAINKSVAFQTARTITTNSEQKQALREMKTGGETLYKEKRAGLIIKSAEEIAGIQRAVYPTGGKIAIGAGRINRGSEASSSSWNWGGQQQQDAVTSAPTSKGPAYTPQGNTPLVGSKNGKSGLGGKGTKKGKGKGVKAKGKSPGNSSQGTNAAPRHAPAGSTYLGKRYDPNFQANKTKGKGKGTSAQTSAQTIG